MHTYVSMYVCVCTFVHVFECVGVYNMNVYNTSYAPTIQLKTVHVDPGSHPQGLYIGMELHGNNHHCGITVLQYTLIRI